MRVDRIVLVVSIQTVFLACEGDVGIVVRGNRANIFPITFVNVGGRFPLLDLDGDQLPAKIIPLLFEKIK